MWFQCIISALCLTVECWLLFSSVPLSFRWSVLFSAGLSLHRKLLKSLSTSALPSCQPVVMSAQLFSNNNSNRIEKRSSRFFYNLLTAPQTISNMYTLVAWAQSHRAMITCNILCHMPDGMKGQLSCQIWQSWNCIYFSFILLAEPLNDEGGEETGVPGGNPRRRASENATYWSRKIQAPTETRTRILALMTGLGKQTCSPLHQSSVCLHGHSC